MSKHITSQLGLGTLSLGLSLVASSLPAPVNAATMFRALLDSAQEVPPAGATNSPATGVATLELIENAPNDFSLSYNLTVSEDIDFTQLIAGTPIEQITGDNSATRLHIHNAERGANGDVVFGIFNPSLEVPSPTVTSNSDGSTTISGAWDNNDGPQPLSNFLSLLQNAQSGDELPLYFNLHTVGDPVGEIRGQIQAVPEPSLVIGLGLTAMLGVVGKTKRLKS